MVVMRVAAGVYLAAIALLSCAAEEARLENRLDLILGGDNPSLREDLRRLDEAMGLVPRPRSPRPRTPRRTQPPPQVQPVPEPEPNPPPRSSPPARVVILQKGDTLWSLAQTHLGAGSRWRELARLNGWSEERASNLPAGTRVKLPQD